MERLADIRSERSRPEPRNRVGHERLEANARLELLHAVSLRRFRAPLTAVRNRPFAVIHEKVMIFQLAAIVVRPRQTIRHLPVGWHPRYIELRLTRERGKHPRHPRWFRDAAVAPTQRPQQPLQRSGKDASSLRCPQSGRALRR